MNSTFNRVGRRLAMVVAAAGLLMFAACASPPPSAPTPTAPAPAISSATGTTATTPAPTVAGVATGAAPSATPGAEAGAAAAPAQAPAPTPPAAAAAGAPRPFAEIVRDARRIDGFVPLWRKDEKVWLELTPDRFGQPFLLAINIASSVGERGLYASQMGPAWLAEFRRVGNMVQLAVLNTTFRGDSDPATQRAVEQGFSDSLLAAGAVASAAHPERRSVLVDASFLLADLVGYSTALERAYRLTYAVDRTNSQFDRARADDRLTTLNLRLHYYTPRIPAPLPFAPPPPAPPPPSPPTTTPDPRSLFVGVVVNFAALPAQPMRPRPADPRLGHFRTSYTELGDDMAPNPRVHHLQRWRLEKKDPQATLSEPLQPIVYWIDRNVPQRYRAAVTEGVLEWNKAFERIGLRDALVVRQQDDDADFDTLDTVHASIRWVVGAGIGFAHGPSHADPRSGEILDADIAISDVFGRGARRLVVEELAAAAGPRAASAPATGLHAHPAGACSYAYEAAAELQTALDLLEARGELEPDSPEVEAIVQAYIRSTITHEVGHTLGLTHNFKASTAVPRARLRDPEYTAEHGIATSVMDYTPFNLPLDGEPRSALVNTTLGAYDYWAIEYAYRPFDPADEAAGLAAIAARSGDPELAFGDDADAAAFDPLTSRFDLGDDPLAWYARRLHLSQELWQRVQARGARPGDDALRLRRSLLVGFGNLVGLPEGVAKYVGGMHVRRDPPGMGGGPTFVPVDPRQQRQALQFLARELFGADSFRFQPQFLASLSPDFNEWGRGGPVSVPLMVLFLQAVALDRLYDAGTAQRLLELPLYLPAAQQRGILTLHEAYATLQAAIWRELATGGEIEPMRRNLQREQLRRVQALLTRGTGTMPADALSLTRQLAVGLQADLRRALARRGLSAVTRAHLADSLAALSESLRATMLRN